MRSRASIKGHAIHPALIAFPVAFLYGAFLFDLAGLLLRSETLWTTGRHLILAGVLSGLVAAVPGAIDFLTTVPPKSTAKQRALKHALANLSALALFTIAWIIRDGAAAPGVPGLVLEAVALVALTMGGWMGGTLVARNQIGIDHRYAQAGKWREQHVETSNGVLTIDRPELEVDQLMLLRSKDRRIVVGRTEDGFVAFDDRCTHRGASLADGVMICGTVQCPWHGSQFDVTSGAVAAGPARRMIQAYQVEQAGSQLRIKLEPRSVPDTIAEKAAD